jgi:hypothetical protein
MRWLLRILPQKAMERDILGKAMAYFAKGQK